jgi:ATP-binding cassette subfamily C (CFTR/MRP) protein 4
VANPTGRILNRFSRDQNLVDEVCPATFFDFIQTTLFCLAAIILLCISLPWLLILVPVIYYLFVFLRSKYIKSSREIKRLEAVSRSPIYADFSAALDGLNTLRAYKLEERITTSFYSQLDKNQRVWHSFLMVSRWLGFRLDFMCTFILIVMVFLSASLKGKYDVGLIGFALVYTLSLSGLAQWSVRQSAEVENQMTAMERINTYAHLPPEVGYKAKLGDAYSPRQTPGFSSHKSDGQQKKSYIATTTSDEDNADMTAVELVVPGGEAEKNFGGGTIDIKNLTVTYRQDLPPVLRQLDIHIWAGCKAGIVGRTGSGT